MKSKDTKKRDFDDIEEAAFIEGDEKREKAKTKAGPFKRLLIAMNHSKTKTIQRTPFKTKLKKALTFDKKGSDKDDNDNFFHKLKNWWPLSKISGKIFLIYAIVIVIGMILLAIPGVVNNGTFHWDFLTSLFTTSSAFSDTGINIANPSQDYSFWGQLIVLFLIEMGGIGILTFKIVLYIAMNKKISINDTNLAQTERGSTNLSSAVVLIRDGFIWLTMVQITAVAILFFAFYFTNPAAETVGNTIDGQAIDLGTVSPFHSFGKSLWFAIFHSTSAVNNAGFDIISGNSLQPYNQQGNTSYLIQIVFLVEWVIGGLGYPTFHDIKRKIKARRNGQYVKFSLFTKLNFVIYFFLFIVGPLSVFGFEYSQKDTSLVFNYYDASKAQLGALKNINITDAKPVGNAVMDIIFNTTSTRNAGFSTVNINDFNAGSKTIMGVLMFIGSAPSSTAGGIRTTTFAILILANYSIVKDRAHTTVFKKTIPDGTVKRAFGVLFLSLILVVLAIAIAYGDSHSALEMGTASHDANTGDSSIIQLFVLVTSAFGTVGMNPFTPEQTYALGAATKIVLIIVMFLGQLGISNTLLVFVKSSSKKQYGYLEEDVPIG